MHGDLGGRQVTVHPELVPTESPCLSPETLHHLTFTSVGALHFKSSGASGVFSFALPDHLEFPEEQGQLHIVRQ